MRVAAVVGLVGAGLLLAGCGSGAVEGNAAAEGAAAGEPVFSPCDGIPDDAIRELGLNPATEERDIMDVKQPGWNICGWRGPDFHVSVFATNHTLEQVRTNDRNEDFKAIDLGDRQATSYREKSDPNRERCDVAVESGGGVVLLSAGYFGSTRPQNADQPCDVVIHAARTFMPYIPE